MQVSDFVARAKNEGRAAYRNGLKLRANPYVGHSLHSNWDSGWWEEYFRDPVNNLRSCS